MKKISVVPAEAMEPIRSGPIRHKLFLATVRTGVRIGLQEKGIHGTKLTQLMDQLSDEMIEQHAVAHSIQAPGDGSFLKWLMDHGPQILELVKTIVTLLALFA